MPDDLHSHHPTHCIAADRLDGAREIALFLFGSDDETAIKRVYRDAAAGVLPIGRRGAVYIASKHKLLAAYDALTEGGHPKSRPLPAAVAEVLGPKLPTRRKPGRPRGGAKQ